MIREKFGLQDFKEVAALHDATANTHQPPAPAQDPFPLHVEVEDLTKGIPFPNSPKEGDMIEWDMGNKVLPGKHLDRTAWYVGRLRFKSWEDCDGDGEFGWNCYIQGEDDEEMSQVFLQDVPFILKHCQSLTFSSATRGPHGKEWAFADEQELIKLLVTLKWLLPVIRPAKTPTYLKRVVKEK